MNEHAWSVAGTWWRHDDVTWHFWKTHFPKCYKHETWSVGTRWKKYSNEHAPAGTWWRHDDVTWHFWKTHFPKCYKHETWSVGTRWKKYSNEHEWWRHDDQQVPDDVMMTSCDIFVKHASQNARNIKVGLLVLGERKIQMSLSQPVLDDVIMMSH